MNRLVTVLIAGLLAASPAIAQVGAADSLLDANLAGQQELESLPEIDAVLAEAIIAGWPDHVIVRTSLIYGLQVIDNGTASFAAALRAPSAPGPAALPPFRPSYRCRA